ncbi:polysaccharide pyruvyl transferase family protein [Janibacter sp. G1551]|uniref:polysaccharide pyruvyl transferase family protein n=1 Tax=Janibacter sp. G1551 TaxID=3420440 RepID=UPI003D092322
MSRVINVLCAPPNGRNAGMASVDMAFGSVAPSGVAVRYWRMWDQSEWIEPPGISCPRPDGTFEDPDTGLTYHLLRGRLDEFLDGDAAVYWGDFLHMAVYQRHTADVLHRRMGLLDEGAARESVADHLLLRSRATERLPQVLSYGSTLGMNTPSDYVGEYGSDLNRFLTAANRVWLRDAYSAQTARIARGNADESCQALDAAFLLGERDRRERDGSLAVFFGRSALAPEALARLGSRVARRLGLQPQLLPWGEEPAFWPIHDRRRFRAAWPGLEHGVANPSAGQRRQTAQGVLRGTSSRAMAPSPSDCFEQIARSSVVLTDTYHLAVNSWRLGTPAILVVDQPGKAWSVNSGEPGTGRDKRHDLYSQLDALGLLVNVAGLGTNLEAPTERVASHLADDTLLEVTHQRLATLKAASRRAVADTLSELVGAGLPTAPAGT